MPEPQKLFGTSHITRRQAIKAGGIAALGLVFAQPIIETIRPRRVFASGNTGSQTGPGSYLLGNTGTTGGSGQT